MTNWNRQHSAARDACTLAYVGQPLGAPHKPNHPVDVKPALQSPGVTAAFFPRRFADEQGSSSLRPCRSNPGTSSILPAHPRAMATRRVRYSVGEAVASGVAPRNQLRGRGPRSEAIDVDYEPPRRVLASLPSPGRVLPQGATEAGNKSCEWVFRGQR